MRRTMAYVPSSDVPSAFLISSDADAVLLDLLGTFVLLDGGSEKVLFTKHVRQIDANVISAPTKAALTNAVELNKETVVPLVGNIPTVKSAGSDGSVAGLLKSIEHASETRPVITPTRFNPKYEPIVISKSLRSGRLELIVLAGDLKEVEALHKAVETGDEHIIEKAASNHGTISVLVWFPARQSDPIKRILHTGTAPLSRIIFALEKARSLPFLHSPVVSTANAFKEVPPPARITNSRVTVPPRVQSATAKTNSTAAKPTPTTRRPVTTTAHGPPSRTTTTTVNKTSPSSVKPSPARPAPTVPSSNRARTVVSSTTVKHTAPANKTGSSSNNKKTAAHEAPIQKTTVNPVKGAAMSRASAAIGKAAGAVVGKTSGTVSSKGVHSKSNGSAPPAPVPVPAPEEVKEPAPTPVEPTPPSPHKPQEVGENGLLDDLEEPPRLMKISMDTDDLKRALENDDTNKNLPHEDEPSKTDVHDDELHKKDSDEKEDLSKNDSSNPAELARKLSRQMIEEASTPLASALASALTDAVGAAQKVGESAYEGIADLASSITETVTEGVKDAAELAQEKMKAMQTRSSLVENDDDNHSVKYEKTDPVIDSVLETVASDSDRVDHALSNGGSGLENKENGKKPEHEVDEDGFRLASADHDLRLHLPPLTAARGNRAASVPHLSRPLFFELVTVPHLNGKCTITDEQSAIEYFTNIRSANYILHSEDVSPAVLDGWLAGKKQWFRDDLKCRLIPTRHHSALMAFVTAQAPELEEHGLVINSSLEHNSISINTEDGREDYHMIKIEL
uniref:Microtubule-associated protein futsch n=1 Tax=Haemonchus contortus TaxID=6289 RepID=A0A7I4XYP6_HAECO